MSFEQIIVAHTEALNANTSMMQRYIDALNANAGAAAVETKQEKAADKSTTTSKDTSAADAAPIYWRNPETGELGTVETEAEWKKLKKAQAKAIKIPESKYNSLLEEQQAQNNDASTDGDLPEFVQARIDSFPAEPEESDIVSMFQAYLSQDLDKEERTARAGLIKPILQKVGAAKATAVKEGDRLEVMTEVTKAMEAHIAETDQTSPFAEGEDDGLV